LKILITGGLGSIGHNLVKKLEDIGYDIIITDTRTNYGIVPHLEINYLIEERLKKIKTKNIHSIDISDKNNIEKLFKNVQPDAVIHLASFPRQRIVNLNPTLGSKVMSEGLLNLLEVALKYKCTKFVYTSSSMVYGDFNNFVEEGAICNPKGQYGIMKLAGEWLIRDYQRRGIDHIILRPSAVYGPLDVEDRVVSKFLLSAIRGTTLKVNGINETLDFTYIDDVVNGIVQAFTSTNTKNKTYNLSRGQSRTLLSAAELAIKIAGKGFIEIKEKDIEFPSRGSLDISAARRDFNFNPTIDIEQGFEEYYNWITKSSYWRSNLHFPVKNEDKYSHENRFSNWWV
jgi:UDP-glucose 4-epimerase